MHGIFSQLRRVSTCAGASILLSITGGFLGAQDPATDPATPVTPQKATKPKDAEATQAEILAEKERVRQAQQDFELRERFSNTVWNDVQLNAGDPGYQWWLRTHKSKERGVKAVQDWYLSDHKQIPKVGTWDVRKGELILIAPDGRIVARGKLEDNEVNGQYYDPDRKQTYGTFQLIEENRRQFNILPFRVIDRNAGK